MKKTLLLLALALAGYTAAANGDPTDQLSALMRSATPTPRSIIDVHIIREDLHIRPGKHTTVSVKYVLWNASDKEYKDIDYGFPIDYQGAGEKYMNSPMIPDSYSDSHSTLGWHDDYIKNVAFFANSKNLPYEVSPEIVISSPAEEPVQDPDLADAYGEWSEEEAELYKDFQTVGRRWFYTRFSIEAGGTLTLEVQYTLRNSYSAAGSSNPVFMEGRISNSFFHYDLSPAVHWGNGKARDFSVEIDVSGINFDDLYSQTHPAENFYGNGIFGLPFTKQGDKLVYTTRNFNFKDAAPISFYYRPSDVPEVAELLSWRIANDKYTLTATDALKGYPASNLADMDLETAWAAPWKGAQGDTIFITFKQPTAISAVLILGGYHKNKDTYLKNNRPKHIWAMEYGMQDTYKDGVGYTGVMTEQTLSITDIWEQQNRPYETVTFSNLPKYSMSLQRYPWSEKVTLIKLWVRDIFPGTEHNDTCISEIIILGDGMFVK